MSATFYTQDEETINRSLDVQIEKPPEDSGYSLDDLYDVETTAQLLSRADYKRIALQFPDELLPYSVPIFRSLKAKTKKGQELYVLADTSYGSCCVDEVAAQHVDADIVVHYGHACLSPTTRLPSLYVFGKKEIEVKHCAASLVKEWRASEPSESIPSTQTIVVMYDVAYAHQAGGIYAALRDTVPPSHVVEMSRLDSRIIPPTPPQTLNSPHKERFDSNETSSQPRHNRLPPALQSENCAIFYVGEESLGLNNILMTNANCNVYSYNPHQRNARLESSRSNRMLMRRYATVQKARDADVFGILIGTLGVASYLPLISQIRKALAQRRKKSYTVSVGKLNPSKLANFAEIECFVLVACPENSVIDSKDFLRPIITPHELGIALSPEPIWPDRYLLDFEEVISQQTLFLNNPSTDQNNDTDAHVDDGENDEDDDRPVFSLVSGTYVHHKRYGGSDSARSADDKEQNALTVRNNDGTIAKVLESPAGIFLQSRSYKGLDPRLGEDTPSILEQGRAGIARGYGEIESPKQTFSET